MKIEIGDFIRTKSGKIRKVKCIVAQYYVTDKLNVSDNNQFTSDEIASHSQNLIDLIEIKDVVEYRELSPFTHNLGTRFHEKYITDIHDEE